jgi:hypothetical protein
MKYDDKIQVSGIFIAPADQAAEGDRLLKSHAAWMESTHYRSGEKALLSFNWSKSPELSDPMDINSAPTGNICFVLTEIYESKAGVVDHWEQTRGSWGDFPAALKWMEKCKVTFVAAASIITSLW